MDPRAAWIICHSLLNLCYVLIYVVSITAYTNFHPKTLGHVCEHTFWPIICWNRKCPLQWKKLGGKKKATHSLLEITCHLSQHGYHSCIEFLHTCARARTYTHTHTNNVICFDLPLKTKFIHHIFIHNICSSTVQQERRVKPQRICLRTCKIKLHYQASEYRCHYLILPEAMKWSGCRDWICWTTLKGTAYIDG